MIDKYILIYLCSSGWKAHCDLFSTRDRAINYAKEAGYHQFKTKLIELD